MYALYARQSRDKKDSLSIESQFEFCMKEVPEGTQIKKYKDKGFSGKNIDRPDFQRLLKDIENGKIEKVVVYRLDRMSRSTLDFAGLMEKFKEYNVDFISTTEKFDTSTPIGKAMLSIVMVFAELERETIQQRITDNYYQRGKKGMHLGGGVPFGFDLIPSNIDGLKTKIYEPNNDIEIVKRMYDEYAYTDKALGRIAKDFNWEGIKTPKNSDWTNLAVRRVVTNASYVKANVDVYNYFKNQGCIIHNEIEEFAGLKGLYVYGKGDNKLSDIEGYNVVIAPHEGVVDSNTWLKCQYKLSKNKQIRNSGKSKYTWLSGLVKCGKCKYAMVVNKAILSVKNNTYGLYFSCSKRRNKLTCTARSSRIENIEGKVKETLFEHIKKLGNDLKIDKSEENKKVNDLKMDIYTIENEIENLLDNLASAKGASMKYINQRLDKLDKKLNKLREELSRENRTDTIDDKKIIELNNLINFWDDITLEEKKEIAAIMIDKIYINNNIIENIEWKQR